MQQFILNIDFDPTAPRPGARIAEILRQAAAVVERQVPVDYHNIFDVYGNEICDWDVPEEPPVRQAARR
jgi:aminopeptidase-like protein